jgi:hypothetical protein
MHIIAASIVVVLAVEGLVNVTDEKEHEFQGLKPD